MYCTVDTNTASIVSFPQLCTLLLFTPSHSSQLDARSHSFPSKHLWLSASHQLPDQIGVAGSEERCYQAAKRRGPLRPRRCHCSPATSWDNIRQGLNQQTGLTLRDQQATYNSVERAVLGWLGGVRGESGAKKWMKGFKETALERGSGSSHFQYICNACQEYGIMNE